MSDRPVVLVVALSLGAFLALEAGDAWARARSGGSRGPRIDSAPAQPAPQRQPASPAGAAAARRPVPATPPAAAPASPLGGLFGALTGFALGGLLGGLLFGGVASGAGFGFLDLLVVGGAVSLLVAVLRRRTVRVPAYAGAAGAVGAGDWAGAADAARDEEAAAELARGLRQIRRTDPRFDVAAFLAAARAMFGSVQSAITLRDAGILRDRLTPEMYAVLQRQCDELRQQRLKNHIEAMDIRQAELTEAWQERGWDYLTAYLGGTIVDYTVDEHGEVRDGSRSEPRDVEELWTFTRPVGDRRWRLASIQTA